MRTGYNQDKPKAKVFNNGDTIIFIGNSITRAGYYISDIYLFYQTRYPNDTIIIYNAGISGGKASGAIKRLNKDVLLRNPGYATIMFGMNDIGYEELYQEGLEITQEIINKRRELIDEYKDNLSKLSTALNEEGVNIIYFTPTIYDETAESDHLNMVGKNKALYECKQIVETEAMKNKCHTVDFYSVLDSINKMIQKESPSSSVVGKDRVHPEKMGHFIMAYTFLKSQKINPYVSKSVVNAKTMKIEESINCNISPPKKNGNSLIFSVLEKSLPYPISKNHEGLKYVPFIDEMNKEELFVKGLQKGTYQLKIDETIIDTFTHDDLQKGINLAYYEITPQHQQALLVKDLNEQRRYIESERLRALALYDHGWFWIEYQENITNLSSFFNKNLEPYIGKDNYPYLRMQADNYMLFKPHENLLKQKVEDLIKSIYHANKPFTHKYTIKSLPE